MARHTPRRTSLGTLHRRLFLEALEDRRTPATFTVVNTLDAGVGSLRQALINANAAAGADTIVFDATAFNTAKTITLTTGELAITDPVTIAGPGAKLAKIDANKASRVFNINIPAAGAAVSISGLTITGGQSTNGGGLLLQDDALTLNECAVVGNSAIGTSADGGGVHIQNGGSLTVLRSTFFGNLSNYGGAIDTYTGGGSILIENSTISGNSATSFGGGIYFRGPAGSGVTIRNSTITNNFAANAGGGIFRAFNSTPGISLESSIVSGNSGNSGSPDINSGNIAVTSNFSAVGSNAGFTSLTGTNNLPFGADLKLGPLADNGGPTQTHALLPGSLAVDAGSNVAGLTIDQRGQQRVVGTKIDIGANEAVNLVAMNTNDAGSGSLRQAIQHANSVAGANTITFDPTLFASAQTITLTTGELPITDAVTITGPGAKLTTVSGNKASRVFNINIPGAGAAVAISGLTITNGNALRGGGILFQDDALTLIECAVVGNTVNSDGGGVHVQGGGSLTVLRSTFSGNAAAYGGAISTYNLGGSLMIENSTISGNSANSTGGGIYFVGPYGSGVTIRNSTITANKASVSGGGILRRFSSIAGISLESSIVSGNFGGGSPDIDSGGIAVTANFSAIGSNAGFLSLIGSSNLPFGADLKLGSLADNGGPTQTHALLPGSPAIDAGSNPTGLTIDQRGQQRVVGTQIDIGANEAVSLVVTNTNDAGSGSLRQTLQHANTIAGANTITFDPTVFASAKTITLSTGELSITDPLTITGPGAKLATVSGNNASRLFNINIPGAGAAVNISGLTITGGKAGTGGGFLLQDDSLTLTECAVVGNAADGDGGGIHVQGGGSVSVRRCTFANNQAPFGGAISTYQGGGSILVENSTLSGNTATLAGGALYFRGEAGVGITIRNSTITANSSPDGGGIYRSSSSTPGIALESSIVSGNGGGSTPDIYSGGIAVVANFSAVGSNAGIPSLSGSNNLPFGADLKLAPLADNGGPTKTHTLLPGSLAVDAGSNVGGLTSDQRGQQRVVGSQIDIGANEAVTLVVMNANDAGSGSLRQTMQHANSVAGANTITFDPAVFTSAKTITLNAGELSIIDPLTITGPGAKLATVSGNNASRVFNINIPGVGMAVGISGLSIAGGSAANGGGFLLLDDALTLTECAVVGNTAGGDGGGIHVYNGGSLTVQRSTFSGNSATWGGAIDFYPVGGSLVVENSTISGNSASGTGGGMIFYGSGGSGIAIRNSTITGNSANTGGGIFRYAGPFITLESSIVSGNNGGGAPDIFSNGTPVLSNFSAIGSNAGLASLVGTGNLPFGADLKLGPLADNGGPTKTHALLSGSAAINTGNMVGAPATDQRGLPRVVGTTDIGAFELQPAAKVANVVVGDGTNQRSLVTQIKVTFDSLVVFIGDPAAAFELFRSKDSAAVNLAAAVSGNDVSLTFTGGAVDGKSLADGLYTLKVHANQIGVEGGFDGDGNGTAGDDYVLTGSISAAPKLFRLFGDADGNGSVTASDFNAFRLAYGLTGSSIFDFDGDNQVSASDFNQFRTRYGITLMP